MLVVVETRKMQRTSNQSLRCARLPSSLICLKHKLLLLFLLFITVIRFQRLVSVSALKITAIDVPAAVQNASHALLACNYDVQGDQLYSVKWYKNYVEFFRFQPQPAAASASSSYLSSSESLAKFEFDLDGVSLNLSKCNATHVYLKSVSLATEGTFKCEVSVDSPSFATVSAERQMKVYILPKLKLSIFESAVLDADGPQATHAQPVVISASNSQTLLDSTSVGVGAQHQHQQMSTASADGHQWAPPVLQAADSRPTYSLRYQINDLINVTCVSGASRPTARLSWLLNDSPVPVSSSWLQHSQQQQQQSALSASKLTIVFRLQPEHLTSSGQLRLRCVARLALVFGAEASVSAAGGRLQAMGGASRRPSAVRLLASAEVSSLLDSGRKRRQVANQSQQRVVWTNKQLRAHAELVDAHLRDARANDVEPPHLEARAVSSRGAVALFEAPSVADGDGGAGGGSGDGDQLQQQQLIDFVNLTCVARFRGRRSSTSPQPQLVWLLNGHRLEPLLNWINVAQVKSAGVTTGFGFDREAGGRHRKPLMPARNMSANNNNGDDESQQPAASLLLEFSASMRALRELDARCQTIAEAPLADYETQVIISTTSASSDSFSSAVAATPFSVSPTSRQQQHHTHFYQLRQPSRLRPQQPSSPFITQKRGASSASKSSATTTPITISSHYYQLLFTALSLGAVFALVC